MTQKALGTSLFGLENSLHNVHDGKASWHDGTCSFSDESFSAHETLARLRSPKQRKAKRYPKRRDILNGKAPPRAVREFSAHFGLSDRHSTEHKYNAILGFLVPLINPIIGSSTSSTLAQYSSHSKSHFGSWTKNPHNSGEKTSPQIGFQQRRDT